MVLRQRGFRTDEARSRIGVRLHIAHEATAAHGVTFHFEANESSGLRCRVERLLVVAWRTS